MEEGHGQEEQLRTVQELDTLPDRVELPSVSGDKASVDHVDSTSMASYKSKQPLVLTKKEGGDAMATLSRRVCGGPMIEVRSVTKSKGQPRYGCGRSVLWNERSGRY